MFKTKTFFDIPNRSWALETPEANFLKSKLPREIWRNLQKTFLETGLGSIEAEALFEYFWENSAMTKSVKVRPSDAIPFEHIYRRLPTTSDVDEYFIRSKSAVGIYLRLLSLKDNLPHILRTGICEADLKENEKFIVLNAGSGPSHEMIDVLAANSDLAEMVHVLAVDTDEASLEIGRKRVAELELNNVFEFIAASFTEIPPAKAHMILLIGILCPLPSSIGEKILQSMLTHCRAEGKIIYSTVQEEMIQGDPLLDVFMRGLQWKMDYKTEAEAVRIAESSGWKVEGAFYDALQYNRMTIAKKILAGQ